jgi:hypothetical protein
MQLRQLSDFDLQLEVAASAISAYLLVVLHSEFCILLERLGMKLM